MNNFTIVNADTDSISFCKPDFSEFSEEEMLDLLKNLNSTLPEKIHFEDDGLFQVFCVLKAKNYIKLHDGEIETKGSAMRNPNKEPALREFIDKVIQCIVYDKQDEILERYYDYVREIHKLQDISRWCTKKTITESVLNPERTTEQKILDSLNGKRVQMGDKIYCYFRTDESLGLREDWNSDHDTVKLLDKLYKTVSIFKNVINIDLFPKFHLKSHNIKCQLADVLGIPHPVKEKRKRVTKDTPQNNNLANSGE